MATRENLLPELTPWEVGIGRPITQASFVAIQEAFQAVMPSEVELDPREIPGINYVSSDKMRKLVERSTLRPAQATELARLIVSSQCANGVLNSETAQKEVSVEVDKYQFRNGDFTSRFLLARLRDQEDHYYPEGYLLDGEKTATLEAIGISRIDTGRRPGKPPRSLLRIGIVTKGGELVTTAMLHELNIALERTVELCPIDIVTSA